jgi:hypothetical protein
VEPYNPPAITAARNYLVVDGFINSGNQASVFTLSRTRTQANASDFIPEGNASVSIEGENGEVYSLAETDIGVYASQPLSLNHTSKYRLRIRTFAGKEYASEYVALKTTPAIDSITWGIEEDGLQFYVSTQDPENITRYYRWEFNEAWEYRSTLYSNFIYKNKKLEFRPTEEQIHTCWNNNVSKEIFLGSSATLAQDVIYRNPVNFTPAVTGKLAFRYSLLLKQYALSREAFEFWQILKKNTESTGSIFDPQPSQLPGNIHCISNPQEPVIGFVCASTVEEKRIFVEGQDLPFSYKNPDEGYCEPDTVPNIPESIIKTFEDGAFLPMVSIGSPAGIIAYSFSYKSCVDCREKGGTTVRPDFWR